ncbi:MAG: hypothetical protein CL521_02095, partial [Actinobacteria bacterium]|nr:hypothetical protein [Actinomycetota bacterium]
MNIPTNKNIKASQRLRDVSKALKGAKQNLLREATQLKELFEILTDDSAMRGTSGSNRRAILANLKKIEGHLDIEQVNVNKGGRWGSKDVNISRIFAKKEQILKGVLGKLKKMPSKSLEDLQLIQSISIKLEQFYISQLKSSAPYDSGPAFEYAESLQFDDLNRLEIEKGLNDDSEPKNFSVWAEDKASLIHPIGILNLIGYYNKKAQRANSSVKLPMAEIITDIKKNKRRSKSTSSQGYIDEIGTPEYRKEHAGQTKVFFVEKRGRRGNESSHIFSLYVKYSDDGKTMDTVALDPVHYRMKNLESKLGIVRTKGDRFIQSKELLQFSATGCQCFALKTYKGFLDHLNDGGDMIDEMLSTESTDTTASNSTEPLIPEWMLRMAQSRKKINIPVDPRLKSKNHSVEKTKEKYLKKLPNGKTVNKYVEIFMLKQVFRLRQLALEEEKKT